MKRRNRKAQCIAQAPRQQQPVPPRWLGAFEQWLRQLPPALRPAARRALVERWPCLLCQAPAATVAAFVPQCPHRWGVAPGWRAGAVYTLCGDCLQLPDVQDLAEAALWQSRHELSAPWN